MSHPSKTQLINNEPPKGQAEAPQVGCRVRCNGEEFIVTQNTIMEFIEGDHVEIRMIESTGKDIKETLGLRYGFIHFEYPGARSRYIDHACNTVLFQPKYNNELNSISLFQISDKKHRKLFSFRVVRIEVL